MPPNSVPAFRLTCGATAGGGVGIALAVLFFLATVFGVVVLATLLVDVALQTTPWLDAAFLTNLPFRFPERAGIRSAILGSLWIMGLTALISVPLGVASAVYLEEYAPPGRFLRLIQINIAGNIVFLVEGVDLRRLTCPSTRPSTRPDAPPAEL